MDGSVTPQPTSAMNANASVLAEASDLIRGERLQQYGPPHMSFAAIAQAWSAYLGIRVTTHDVAMLNVLEKCIRQRDGYHRDSTVDIAGYAGLAEALTEYTPTEWHEST